MGGAVGTAGAKSGKSKKCDIVVPEDYTTIQAAVDNANSGNTICVRAGTYSDVSVNKGVTVRGVNDPDGPDAAVVDGSVEVSANNATVSRLKVAPTTTFVSGGLDPHGILVSGALSDVTIKENIVEGMTADSTGGSVTINGIQLWNEEEEDWQTGTVVKNNTVRDMDNMGDAAAGWPNYGGAAAIKVQGVVMDTKVASNTVEAVHSAGWTYGIVTTHTGNAPGISPKNTTVEMNTIVEVNDGSVYDVFEDTESAPYLGTAFAIDGDSLASEATPHLNDFLQTPIGAHNKDDANTLDAECNYWGHATGPEDEDNKKGKGNKAVGDIDYTPWNTRKVGRGENSEKSCVGGKNADKGNKKGR